MEFTKIRRKDKGVELAFRQKPEAKGFKQALHEYQCGDEPAPEFDEAMQALRPEVVRILGLPNAWDDEDVMTVTGATLSEKETLVTAKVTIQGLSRPLNINGPMIPNALAEDGSGEAWGEDFMALIDDLCGQARKYYNGDRQQQALDLDGCDS